MKLNLKPNHLRRYKDIALLLLKYGRSDMVDEIGLDEALEEPDLPRNGRKEITPDELANDLEAMGPTFVKLGQLLSSRADLLPERYLRALARLQDNVKPFPYAEVEAAIQQELGVRISKAFSMFDPEPLAAASLGQVHRASLRDGRPVVVKVQRPGIRKQIAEDMDVIEEISSFLQSHTKTGQRYQFQKIFEEFKRTLQQELEYEREAANLLLLRENLKEFTRLHVPQPIQDYTTRSVLTMDYVPGRKITSLGPLIRLETDLRPLAEELFKAYLKQVLVDGVFHADPHPGNIFLTDDCRIALLDLGMIGRTTPSMQDQLLRLLVAISEGRGDEAAEVAIKLGTATPEFTESEFRRNIGYLVAEHKDNALQDIDVGKALLELGRSAGENGLYVPTELTMLGKTLLQLDEIGKILDPNFNPNQAVRRHVTEIVNRRTVKQLSMGKIFASALEVKEFVGTLPNRLNKILDAVANAELEVKVKASDVELLLEGFQKIANRITTGLILAALIIGASLLMQVQTTFRIFGYPGFAILCFVMAAAGGFWLVFNILVHDYRDRKKAKKQGTK